MVLAIVIFTSLLMTIDTLFYIHAPFPERTKSFWYKLPIGGIVAYFSLPKEE
uniref:Uncharacterized protein n=1 Tax=viral metagenome TaxID=1070528 RepID=A0A6M3Y4X5_9ZZZZ